MNQNRVNTQMRRNEAMQKAKRAQAQLKLVEYRVENGDVLILSGPYNGKVVSELWAQGPNERDYIVKNLCMRNDSQVLDMIRKLCGK
jgi:hypothetical protein